MNLTKKQIEKISKLYDLGKVKRTKLIEQGMISHNFEFETEKGKFIVRVLRKNPSKEYLDYRKVEFRVLNYLKKKKFPYQIPWPIKNNQKKQLSKISGRYFFVYHYIEGETCEKPRELEIKEFAKALAIYHNIIKKLKIKSTRKDVRKPLWLVKEYERMGKTKRKRKLDKIMLSNLEMFKEALNKILKINFKGEMLLTHSDFQKKNILFKDKKVSGILDFDNLDYNLKAKDISICVKSTCFPKKKLDKKILNDFLKEYRKHERLTKAEEKQIVPLIIRNFCVVFWWAYKGKMKDEKNRMHLLTYFLPNMKNLLEEIK